MSSFIRTVRLLLAVACVCQFVAISPLVQCQSAVGAEHRTPDPSGQDQNAQAVPKSPATADAPDDPNSASSNDEQPMSQIQMDGFVHLIHNHSCLGYWFKNMSKPDQDTFVPPTNYTKLMGIRSDEVEAMCAICDKAVDQARENDQRWSDFNNAYYHDHGNVNVTAHNIPPELSAKSHEWGLQRTKIYEDAVAELRQALGEESFKKVASWVEQHEKDDRAVLTGIDKRRAEKSKPPQSEENSGSEQAPAVPK